jgi:RNA polymerase sigma factor for flagellar operon FliA
MYAAARGFESERLVEQHLDLVKRIACHLLGRLPANVQLEDLVQSGTIGLLEAARNFNAAQGASFETYAGIRIRGAMLDEVRRNDWTPRSVHRNARRVSAAIRAVEGATGREAQPREIAATLEVGIDEYHAMARDTVAARLFSLSELGEEDGNFEDRLPGEEPGPEQVFDREAFARDLAEAISGLPEREQLVMSLYYEQDMNLREIGAVLGVTESRVCQLHGQALARVRARLTNWTRDDEDMD